MLEKTVEKIIDTSENEEKTKKALIIAKRNSSKQYNQSIQRACQALASGTYDTLTDGTEISGAEILAINAFERAKDNDKALQTYAKLTGDLKDAAPVQVTFEDMLKDLKKEM